MISLFYIYILKFYKKGKLINKKKKIKNTNIYKKEFWKD